ncbi:histidinol-phosphatase [Coprinopsis sp. MPI-PUGE-AT-0042]|nr:histidinol-phosphatase [Coprinopsis sp. MPI-PUGE-AT-0042]
MPHSHHSHSGQFCKHAKGTLEEVVLEAIEQKFEVYGLTEHVPRYRVDDLYPEEAGMSLDALGAQFEAFLDEAHRLKSKYAEKITLLVGLETEYITEADLTELDQLLKRFGSQVEYIVGSVHHVKETPIDFDRFTYERLLKTFSPTEDQADLSDPRGDFYSSYFDAQYQLLTRFQPEIIGHFDLCSLYDPYTRLPNYPEVWEKAVRNIRFAVSYGALFEVNAAAFRKNWSSAYPAADVLKVIIQEGGRLALSDDSHGPHAVGLNYAKTREYLKSAGVNELWYLAKGEESNQAGRDIRPIRLEGAWDDHPFWTLDHPQS